MSIVFFESIYGNSIGKLKEFKGPVNNFSSFGSLSCTGVLLDTSASGSIGFGGASVSFCVWSNPSIKYTRGHS